MSFSTSKALIVHPEFATLKAISLRLEAQGFFVLIAENTEQAIEQLSYGHFDVIFADSAQADILKTFSQHAAFKDFYQVP